MRVGILGSGTVGRTLAGKIASQGHAVVLGTRDPAALLDGDPADEGSFAHWHRDHDEVVVATLAECAAHGEVLFNATAGTGSLAALEAAGHGNLADKILVDVANALDASRGFPPTLAVVNDDSLGEQIQRALPQTRVVKALNTVNAAIMVDPGSLRDGDHDLLICGDDEGAKAAVHVILRDWFGWRHVVDVGGISAARGTEMYLALWLRLMAALGTPAFNIKVVVGPAPGSA